MTRLLLVSTILTTAVLFKALQDRPPILAPLETGVTDTSSSNTQTGAAKQDDTIPEVSSWPEDLQAQARKALLEWRLDREILPQIDLMIKRTAQEEELRIHWICKEGLLEIAKNYGKDHHQLSHLKLNTGQLIKYKSLVIHKGLCLLELPGDVQIQIPVTEILETKAQPDAVSASAVQAGSLSDTLDMVNRIVEKQTIGELRWLAWFDNGGPESLCPLLPSDRSRVLTMSITTLWGKRTVQGINPQTDGKSPHELATWMAAMRTKLRDGFPTEDRQATLLTLESWQDWLDREGPKAYRSSQAYQKISRDLRLLQLDIVKSTGF